MKVHILNLEPEEDHASARDKISRARAPKVVLVWPRRGRPLNRQLDLAIVLRHANRLGCDIGLIAFDPEITDHARRLRIPVFDSLEDLPPGTWNLPVEPQIEHREQPSLADLRAAREEANQPLYQLDDRGRWIAIGISIAAVFAIVVSTAPSAEIILEPTGIPLERDISLWIDPQPSGSSNRIPGQVVRTEVTGSRRIDTTGRVRLPLEFATGDIEVTNLTDEEVTIPAGSGFRAGEVRFLATSEHQLEAGEGSTAVVPIEAAEPGVTGNVPAGAIDSVEGSLGFLITVSNDAPTRGGRDQFAPAVEAADMEDLRQELEAELIEEAESELGTLLDRGFSLVPGSIRIAEVVEESFDFAPGEASESLGLTLTLAIEGLGYSAPDALEVAESELAASLPPDRLLIPGSLSIDAIDSAPDWPAVEVEFAAEGTTAEAMDREELRQSVAGSRKEEAADRLEGLLGLERAPLIRTTPSWLPWLPWLGMRIDIQWIWENGSS